MENDETPAWAKELRDFTVFTIGNLEQRLNVRFDSLETRMDTLETKMSAFENRIVRKIDAMDSRIGARLDAVEKDVAVLKKRRKASS
jgi:hypothetical protein